MIVDGKIEYKYAIRVDSDLLRNLTYIVSEYFSIPTFKAELINGDEVIFDNFDELLNFDNFKSCSIKSLYLYFGTYNKILFEPTISLWTRYGASVCIDFSFDSIKKSEEFKREIKNELDKHRQPISWTIISKLSYIQLSIIILVISSLLNIRNIIYKVEEKETIPYSLTNIIVLLCVAFCAFIIKTGSYLLDRFYPPINSFFNISIPIDFYIKTT